MTSDNSSGPTLTDAKGMGGLNAADGFDYQIWDALIRLPQWLVNPAFEGFILEGLEDVEARFFSPYAPQGRLLDRYQAKSGSLTRGDIIEVLESFKAFEKAHPTAARSHTLVTPALPVHLQWLSRDPGRVRKARPFYAPFPDVVQASDDKLRKDLTAEFGKELGILFADSVEISLRPIMDHQTVAAAFDLALDAAFPDLNLSRRTASGLFDALGNFASKRRGEFISRQALVEQISTAAVASPFPPFLKIHVKSANGGETSDAIEVDASQFSDFSKSGLQSTQWASNLREPVSRAADWARTMHHTRIRFSGSFRLSTAFTLGWAFRSAIGFELEVPQKSGEIWKSDQREPVATQPWEIREPTALGRTLLVSVGVIRDPLVDVCRTHSVSASEVMSVRTAEPIRNGDEAQAFVNAVKGAVSRVAAAARVSEVKLHFAGPAGLAVMLGHRWNALPATQLYEFQSPDSSYAFIGTIP